MKQPPPGTEERIAKMTFASIYPLYVSKVEKKGRTQKELHEVIKWLTGYDEKKLKSLIDDEVTFDTFFEKCKLNSNARLITGVVCGYRVGEPINSKGQVSRQADRRVGEGMEIGKNIAC